MAFSIRVGVRGVKRLDDRRLHAVSVPRQSAGQAVYRGDAGRDEGYRETVTWMISEWLESRMILSLILFQIGFSGHVERQNITLGFLDSNFIEQQVGSSRKKSAMASNY